MDFSQAGQVAIGGPETILALIAAHATCGDNYPAKTHQQHALIQTHVADITATTAWTCLHLLFICLDAPPYGFGHGAATRLYHHGFNGVDISAFGEVQV